MLRTLFSFASAFFFSIGILPLALASLHWNSKPLFAFLDMNPYSPYLLGIMGILCGCLGKGGETKLNLILMNSLNLGLYLIVVNLLIRNL